MNLAPLAPDEDTQEEGDSQEEDTQSNQEQQANWENSVEKPAKKPLSWNPSKITVALG